MSHSIIIIITIIIIIIINFCKFKVVGLAFHKKKGGGRNVFTQFNGFFFLAEQVQITKDFREVKYGPDLFKGFQKEK